MIQCTNCGQVNTDISNFCRFCGTKFLQTQQQTIEPNYEYSPPSPYSWKTDEFQVTENKRQKNQQINQVQPLGGNQAPGAPQQLVYQQQQNMAFPYRCPRCANQMMPRVVKRISTAGWITFAVLMVMFFPLFWIGLLIKEEVRICPFCNMQIN